jgi:hypothetical protein
VQQISPFSNEFGRRAISYHFPAYFSRSTPGTVVSVFIGDEQEAKMMSARKKDLRDKVFQCFIVPKFQSSKVPNQNHNLLTTF